MGEMSDLIEKGLSNAALEARMRYDDARKVRDEAAVKIELRVICTVNDCCFAPPLEIVVNEEKQTGEINGSGSRSGRKVQSKSR